MTKNQRALGEFIIGVLAFSFSLAWHGDQNQLRPYAMTALGGFAMGCSFMLFDGWGKRNG